MLAYSVHQQMNGAMVYIFMTLRSSLTLQVCWEICLQNQVRNVWQVQFPIQLAMHVCPVQQARAVVRQQHARCAREAMRSLILENRTAISVELGSLPKQNSLLLVQAVPSTHSQVM